MIHIYDELSFEISKIVTNKYSTSFSLGIFALDKKYHYPIYSIYGLVRVADEIVDTFHNSNKKALLEKFKSDTYEAIKNKISTNPVLHAFQKTVHEYKIPISLIDAFFNSMEMDIYQGNYTREDYDKYIFGSAEVVGLMCLKIFVDGDEDKFNKLSHQTRALGSAFQKVNFLRDLGSDIYERNRIYLPEVYNLSEITDAELQKLINETEKEFEIALDGIRKLPEQVKLGTQKLLQFI